MLSLLARIYGRFTELRNTLYDKGVFEEVDLRATTISVGNITTGGTGKTPLTAYLADLTARRGKKVCILTRGYGRPDAARRVVVSDGEQVLADVSKAGDEPYELAQKLLGKAIVIADADRIAAAEWAKRKFAVTTFILDDGFQHRKVKRDVDIVCVDATDPFGGRAMLPKGRLREPIENLSRADVIVITRSDLIKDPGSLKTEIIEINPIAPLFLAGSKIIRITPLEDFLNKTHTSVGQERSSQNDDVWNMLRGGHTAEDGPIVLGAFCALGNPDSFFRHLWMELAQKQTSFELPMTRAFRDHYQYTQNDVRSIEGEAGRVGARAIVTTVKDAVKLQGLVFEIPCFVVEIEVTVDDPQAFEAAIYRFREGGSFLSPQ